MTDPHSKGGERLLQASEAARCGELEVLRDILHTWPDVLDARDGEGHGLLSLACRAATGEVAIPPVAGTPDQHAAVDLVLAAGADVAASANNGWAPLHTAAMAGHVDLARRLLRAGAPREGRLLGCHGGSPLALALFYAHTDVAELLAEPPIPDNLRTAAALGRPLERFSDGAQLTPRAAEGVDFYRPSPQFPEWERTGGRQELLDEALGWAARNDQCRSLEALVEAGAEVNANPYRGSALLWATYSDKLSAATWLLDHGADPDLQHDWGGTGHGVGAVAMHMAAQFGSLRCLQLLLERGADRSIRDAANHATPLEWAEYSECAEAAAMLRG